MQIRLTKPWRPLTAEEVRKLPGQLGVYELADASGAVVYIGFAGAKELFGLRSALQRHAGAGTGGAVSFRVEVNMQYTSRFKELLMSHRMDHGDIPPVNRTEPPVKVGRLS